MIVRNPQSWFRPLFVWNGSVLQSILPQLLFIGAVSCVAVLTHGRIFGEKIPLWLAGVVGRALLALPFHRLVMAAQS